MQKPATLHPQRTIGMPDKVMRGICSPKNVDCSYISDPYIQWYRNYITYSNNYSLYEVSGY